MLSRKNYSTSGFDAQLSIDNSSLHGFMSSVNFRASRMYDDVLVLPAGAVAPPSRKSSGDEYETRKASHPTMRNSADRGRTTEAEGGQIFVPPSYLARQAADKYGPAALVIVPSSGSADAAHALEEITGSSCEPSPATSALGASPSSPKKRGIKGLMVRIFRH